LIENVSTNVQRSSYHEGNIMSRVLLTQPFAPFVYNAIRDMLGPGIEVGIVSSFDLADFAHCAQDAEVLMNFGRPLNDELLLLAPRVRFVQQVSAGYDALDLTALAQRQIRAANAPGGNAEAVAEHTLLLMLSLLKRYTQAEQSTRDNKWEMMRFLQAGIGDLGTATVGLIGFGAIGQAVAQRLRGFGVKTLYTAWHRLELAEEKKLGVEYASLPDLLTEATIVSLHLPLNEQSYHLIGADQLALMRPDAIIINTSRGRLIDEQALRSALLQQQIAGAGLDVLEQEKDGGNIFADLPQVIVTPHIGGLSQYSLKRIMSMATDNVTRYLQGKQPNYMLF
jgi:glyoxylate reductase